MFFLNREKKRKKAFTLSELLVTMLILGLVASATLIVLFVFFENFSQNDELTSARQNAEMVATIVGKSILGAGLGMPAASSDFQASFAGNTVASWERPIHFQGNASEGDFLDVAYAIPSGRTATQEYILAPGTFTFNLTSGDSIDSSKVTKTDSAKISNWVVFPTLAFPLSVQDFTADSVRATASNAGTVSFFDELHFVRATRYSLNTTTGEFLVDDEVASGTTKPVARVEGIGGLYFRFDSSRRILTMWVLARGNVRHDELISPSSLPEWTAVSSDIPNAAENRHFRLTVLQTSWRVRN